VRRVAKKKYPRLKGRVRALARKYVAEEVETKKYPREQAVAIGISRARAEVAETRRREKISGIMKRYR
jgi:hypothetical protein